MSAQGRERLKRVRDGFDADGAEKIGAHEERSAVSTGSRRRVVVLCHERDRTATDGYLITHLAPYWRAEGIEVEFVVGSRK
jgi:hypothetical protein